MSFEIKYSKAANISNPIDMDSEFPEKVDHLVTATRQRKPQNKRCRQNTQNLLQKDHNLQIVKRAKLTFDLDNQLRRVYHTSSEWSFPCQ
jgi:hypothetical protein